MHVMVGWVTKDPSQGSFRLFCRVGGRSLYPSRLSSRISSLRVVRRHKSELLQPVSTRDFCQNHSLSLSKSGLEHVSCLVHCCDAANPGTLYPQPPDLLALPTGSWFLGCISSHLFTGSHCIRPGSLCVGIRYSKQFRHTNIQGL